MSDTSIDEELPMAEGAGRTSPLVIPLSAEMREVAQSDRAVAMSPEEARQLVFSRLLGYANGQENTFRGVPLIGGALASVSGGDSPYTVEEAWFAAAVADLVVQGLDDETRVDAVLGGLDLRPYMALAVQNPEAVVAQSQVRDIIENSGMELELREGAIRAGDSINVSLVAQSALDNATQQEIDLINEFRQENELGPLTEADLTAINDFSADAVGATPAAKYLDALSTQGGVTVDGQPVAGSAKTIEEILAGAGEEVLDTGGVLFDRAQIEEWMRTGGTTFDELLQNQVQGEQEGLLAPGDNVYGFDVGQMRGGGPRRGPVRAGSTMSVVDALDYPNNLDDATFTQLQDRLAKAGYFTRLGLQPERGYQFDDATHQAWRMALTDSVKRGTSIPQLLDQQALEWQTRTQERMRRFSVTDTRNAANVMAQEVLGRNLNGDEYNVVRTFLTNMQNERRTQLASGQTDNLGWLNENMDLEVGFGEDDIAQAVDKAVRTDVEAYAGGQAIQALNGFFDVKTPMAPK